MRSMNGDTFRREFVGGYLKVPTFHVKPFGRHSADQCDGHKTRRYMKRMKRL